MERLAEMMTFAKVVETKSFSEAAKALSTSKSLVSKQVSNLESALGVRLLNRTTRRMSLTEIGAAYYEHCVRIAHEIDAAGETITQLQAEPRGVLRITSPVIFASLHLAPALRTFLQRHQQVEVELNEHQCLVYQGIPALRSGWRYRVGTKEVTLHVAGRCRVNNSEVLLQMALDGMGIVLFPTYVLGPLLKSGRLQQILPDSVANPDTSLYATYLPNRYMQPKVRAFIDHLLDHFGPAPYWDQF
jgi:DNA-binding transcriptional LysR family regulator